jgi:hypothetical protein
MRATSLVQLASNQQLASLHMARSSIPLQCKSSSRVQVLQVLLQTHQGQRGSQQRLVAAVVAHLAGRTAVAVHT